MQPTNNFDWRAADAYLFDIDGTLLNTRDGVHYYSFRNVLKNIFGIDASLEGVPVHGNTDVGILRAVIRRAGISDTSFEEKLPLIVQQMSDKLKASALRFVQIFVPPSRNCSSLCALPANCWGLLPEISNASAGPNSQPQT